MCCVRIIIVTITIASTIPELPTVVSTLVAMLQHLLSQMQFNTCSVQYQYIDSRLPTGQT